MPLTTSDEYAEAKARLALIEAEYEALRHTEEAKIKGSDVREKLKADGQIMNDLRDEVREYEISKGMSAAGYIVTVPGPDGGTISTEVSG